MERPKMSANRKEYAWWTTKKEEAAYALRVEFRVKPSRRLRGLPLEPSVLDVLMPGGRGEKGRAPSD